MYGKQLALLPAIQTDVLEQLLQVGFLRHVLVESGPGNYYAFM